MGDRTDQERVQACPTELSRAFAQSTRVMHAGKGQTIFSTGDDARDVFWIRSGSVQISMLSAGGKKIVLRELGAGEIFGQLAIIDRLPRSANAVALEPTQLAYLNGEDFRTVLGTVPAAGLWMANQLAELVRDLSERALALATLPVATRVQAELLRLARYHPGTSAQGDSVRLDKAPTHAEIAARIGTHREAVSRELGFLSADGIVRQSGRSLHILSIARLRALSSRHDS